MSNASTSATATPPVEWSLDNRGYIHGGGDLEIFTKVKKKHNSGVTRRKNALRGLSKGPIFDVNTIHAPRTLSAAEVYRMTRNGMNHIPKGSS